MVKIYPLETIYNGDKFDNGIEARWAVFFTSLGIRYQYIPGMRNFTTGEYACTRFWIESLDSSVLIRSDKLTDQEIDTAKRIATVTNKYCILIWGAPFGRAIKSDAYPACILNYRFMLIPPRCYSSTDPRPKRKVYATHEESLDALFNGESSVIFDPNIPSKNEIYSTCCIFAICRRCPALSFIEVEHYELRDPITSENSEGSGTLEAECRKNCSGSVDREPIYDDERLIAAYTAARTAQFD